VEGAVAVVTARPRLLFLCQTLPYPPDGGVWLRTYHILRLLAGVFDVTALCFERANAADMADLKVRTTPAVEDLKVRTTDLEVFQIPQKHSRLRFVWDHVRSAALRRVYTHYVYDSRAFRRRLAHLLRTSRFDVVHIDSLVDLGRYLPAFDGIPVVGVHHDVGSALLRRRAAIDTNRWRGAYVRYQAALMTRAERTWCERVALNVAVSDPDRIHLARIAPAARIAVVPNGVDLDEFRADAAPSGQGIAYVGGTMPFPNADALDFFSRQILPHLRALRPHLPVRWIGRASAEQQRSYREQHGIELTRYVDDVRPLMRDAACHVVPLRVAGGTRLKILNAWAMGKAVVSTSIGCEGLAAADGENILIRDEPEAFARAVDSVLENHALRRRLEIEGRATVERLYGWNAIGRTMVEAYLRLPHAQIGKPSSIRAAVRGEVRTQLG
jgi:polysaccharide biosynthesis protein PslH